MPTTSMPWSTASPRTIATTRPPIRGAASTAGLEVRSNWEQIFAAVPDIRASVIASAVDGDVIWSEWEIRGTQVATVGST